jgi:hypothetical protein
MEEIFQTVDEIFPELVDMLKRKHPELVRLYEQRYEYVKGPYSPAVRLHNAQQILRAYLVLKQAVKSSWHP